MKYGLIGLALCSALFLLPAALAGEAQTASGGVPVSAGPITAWTAPLVGKGQLVVQPFAFFTRTRGTFNSDGDYTALPDGEQKSQVQEQLFVQYGLTDRWEVDGQLAYLENYLTRDGVKSHDQGPGDSYLFTRYQLVGENTSLPEVSGLLQLKIPTGKYQHLDEEKRGTDARGTGSWDPGIGLIVTKKLNPFLVHADLVVSFPQEVSVDDKKTRYGHYLNYDLAFEYFLPRGFNLMLEANGLCQGRTELDGEQVPDSEVRSLTLSPGLGWSNDRIQTLIAYQRTVWGRNADVNDAIVATLVYTF